MYLAYNVKYNTVFVFNNRVQYSDDPPMFSYKNYIPLSNTIHTLDTNTRQVVLTKIKEVSKYISTNDLSFYDAQITEI